MTTSITDARFTHLHATRGYLLALLTDEEPMRTGWSVMPGFDQNVEIPEHLKPPAIDADETLPSQLHPSYPYGRPKQGRTGLRAVGNLLGDLGGHEQAPAWDELNLDALLERSDGREVPPVMAGSKRPPSPPSPALRPNHIPPPRSSHLRHQLERQRHATPPAPPDPFDAPVPNETYIEEEPSGDQQQVAEEAAAESPQ